MSVIYATDRVFLPPLPFRGRGLCRRGPCHHGQYCRGVRLIVGAPPGSPAPPPAGRAPLGCVLAEWPTSHLSVLKSAKITNIYNLQHVHVEPNFS